jgi:hypothetical protein
MANPNIVNVATITGKTAVQSITTTEGAIVENTADSGKILKINTLIVSNIDGAAPAEVTVDLFRSSTSYKLANTVSVPADSSIVILSKDTAIYLEEGDSLRLLASADGDLQAVVSYEEIS